MADLGKLRYVAEIDDRQFNAKADRLTHRLNTLRNLAGAAIGGITAGAAAGAASASRLDALAKTSRISGVSGGFLHQLRFAGGRVAGASPQEVDQFTTTFNRRLGRLQAGGKGALAEGLRGMGEVGLANALYRSRSTEEAVMALAAGMQGRSPAEAGALIQAAGGSDRLSLLFREGPEGLRRAMGQARRPPSSRQLRQAEAFEDSRAALSENLSGMGRDALGPLAPVMTATLDRANERLSGGVGDALRPRATDIPMIGLLSDIRDLLSSMNASTTRNLP